MSAGMSCRIYIKFAPEINADIKTHLPILAETGPVYIPIHCTYKKAIVKALNPVLDFGDVTFGEDKTLNIQLENFGALETLLKIKDISGNTLRDKTETMSAYSRMQSVIRCKFFFLNKQKQVMMKRRRKSLQEIS